MLKKNYAWFQTVRGEFMGPVHQSGNFCRQSLDNRQKKRCCNQIGGMDALVQLSDNLSYRSNSSLTAIANFSIR